MRAGGKYHKSSAAFGVGVMVVESVKDPSDVKSISPRPLGSKSKASIYLLPRLFLKNMLYLFVCDSNQAAIKCVPIEQLTSYCESRDGHVVCHPFPPRPLSLIQITTD